MNRIYLLILIIVFVGCASLGSVKKTNQLQQGMTIDEVKQVMGNPSQTQFIGDKIVLKYNLHEYFKGWVPYYLAFNKKIGTLEAWFSDEAEYYRNQKLWLEAQPKRVMVDAKIDQNIEEKIDVNIDGTIRHR